MKKLITFILLLVLFGSNRIMAQTLTDADSNLVFTFVEQMPQYPGGDEAMYKFLKQNLKYPKEAKEAKIEGKVVVRFVVNRDGHISDISQVGKKLGYGCDEEALRVVALMPNWTPAKQNGKLVRCYYMLPVKFIL